MQETDVKSRQFEDGMTDTTERLVSIVKCAEIDNAESVHETTLESLDLIGGLELLVCPGDTVLLKPNVLCPFDYRTGAVTNPYLVRAMCRLVLAAGAKKIIIAESAAVGFDNVFYNSQSETGALLLASSRKEHRHAKPQVPRNPRPGAQTRAER